MAVQRGGKTRAREVARKGNNDGSGGGAMAGLTFEQVGDRVIR